MHYIPTCNLVFFKLSKNRENKSENKMKKKKKEKVELAGKLFYQLIYNSENICYTNRVFKMAAISGRKILNFTHFFFLSFVLFLNLCRFYCVE